MISNLSKATDEDLANEMKTLAERAKDVYTELVKRRKDNMATKHEDVK